MVAELLQDFLDYYVLGTPFPGDESKSFGGIRRRQPALVGPSPDFEPFAVGGALDGTAVPSVEFEAELGTLPPDIRPRPEEGRFLDVCALEDAKVELRGQSIKLELTWASSYPEGVFVRGSVRPVRVFPMGGQSQPSLVANELMERINQFLGDEANGLSWSVEIKTEPFERMKTR